MSKVIMSLQEYNDLMDKLHKYERIVKQLTTPIINSWDYEYFQKNPKLPLHLYGKLRDYDLVAFFKDEIIKNVEADPNLYQKLSEYEPEFVFESMHLFTVRNEIVEEVHEVEEREG